MAAEVQRIPAPAGLRARVVVLRLVAAALQAEAQLYPVVPRGCRAALRQAARAEMAMGMVRVVEAAAIQQGAVMDRAAMLAEAIPLLRMVAAMPILKRAPLDSP